MNVMTGYNEAPTQQPHEFADASAAPVAEMAASPDTFTLRRSGGRPVVFTGVQLAMAMNFVPGCPMWYEINMYRLADGRFVADVRCFKPNPDEDDTFTVFETDSFEDALHKLETYDASRDVRINFDLDDPSLSVADLTFRALALRVRVENARTIYRSLLGQVLYDLNPAA